MICITELVLCSNLVIGGVIFILLHTFSTNWTFDWNIIASEWATYCEFRVLLVRVVIGQLRNRLAKNIESMSEKDSFRSKLFFCDTCSSFDGDG